MKLKIAFLTLFGIGLTLAFLPKEKSKDVALLKKIVATTAANHLQPRVLNDSLSKEIYDLYLSRIDPEKQFLDQNDLKQLAVYQQELDEAFQQGDFQFFEEVQVVLKQAISDAERYCMKILDQDLDLLEMESLETDARKLAFAKDANALEDRWRKKIKQAILEELFVQENGENANVSLEQKQKKAVEKVKQLFATRFQQFHAMEAYERRDQYLNTFLNIHDVQTEYLSAERKADWDAAFTRSFVGVGMQLVIEDAYPKITRLTIGGPAWQSKQISPGDIILSIKEEQQTSVDVFAKSMKSVLALLKGAKGTKLSLKIKKSNNSIKEITLQREAISFDLAMSFLISDQGRKIGYLRLPRFYAGEEGAAYHVLKEIQALKKNKIDGLIFDVRNNRGGSSREAMDIISYFLDEGMVMQVKYQNGEHRTYEDSDGKAVYDGNLIVLMNSRSSSASELFAGTMKDYARALIVGSEATYGKGTMQRFYNMDVELDGKVHALGDIKMSIGRFFTASGRSPQYHGIASDISLPDDDSFVPSGERVYPYALTNEDLPITPCVQNINTIADLAKLKANSKARIQASERFQLASQKAYQRKEQTQNSLISLNYKNYKKARETQQTATGTYQKIFETIPTFEVNLLAEDLLIPDSSSYIQSKLPWQQRIQQDPYIYECYQIMKDILS